MKFGGTSVGNSKNILNLVNIVKDNLKDNPIVVVSAISGVTDILIHGASDILSKEKSIEEVIQKIKSKHFEIMQDLGVEMTLIDNNLNLLKEKYENLNDLSKKTMDELISFGERMSSKIVSASLRKEGVDSKAYNAYNLGMITDSNFGCSEPLPISFELIRKSISRIENVPVITGFIGKDTNDQITTLGRGGSDYSAAILGNAINAKKIQIWTDVNGVMTTDPRIVKDAKSLEFLTFDEASELAFFGAKVLHPRTMIPAIEKNIPIEVKNTMQPNHIGTTIVKQLNDCESIVTAISLKKKVKIIRVSSTRMLNAYGFLAKIFSTFEKHNTSVDMVSTSEVSVSITLNEDDNHDEIVKELSEFSNVEVIENNNLVCVVGRNLCKDGTIHGEIFSCLEKDGIKIKMISQGASLINVSFIVDEINGKKSVELLHNKFITNVL